MENSNSNSNPEVNQLPEADSLPDGFVESSEGEMNDYKEEKLLEPSFRPEVVIENSGSDASSCKLDTSASNGSAEAVSGEEATRTKCNFPDCFIDC